MADPKCRTCKHTSKSHPDANPGLRLTGRLAGAECAPLRNGRRSRCACPEWNPPPPRPPCPLGNPSHDKAARPLCSCVPGQIAMDA